MPEALKPLTALRFVAAVWVIVYAAWPSLGVPAPFWVARGYLGVDLFFCLSGFILCHVYLRDIEAGRFRYKAFLWARLARIYPIHLVTLVGLGAMVFVGEALGEKATGNVVVWSSLPAQLSLTQAWGLSPLGGWNHPSWSISAEWFAYLCFPLFAAAALRWKQRPWLAALVAILCLYGTGTLFQIWAGQSLNHATIAWGALRIVPDFLLGCAAYQIWSTRRQWPFALGAAVTSTSFALLLAGLALGAPDWSVIASFSGVIFGLAVVAKFEGGLWQAPVLVFLGEASYAFYMLHAPWSIVFDRLAGSVLHLQGKPMPVFIWLLELVGLQLAAIILHFLVERPARTAMRRYGATGLFALSWRRALDFIARVLGRRAPA